MLHKEKAKRKQHGRILALVLAGILIFDLQSFAVQAFTAPILAEEKINLNPIAEQDGSDKENVPERGISDGTDPQTATESDYQPAEKPERVEDTRNITNEQQLRDSVEKAEEGDVLELVLHNSIKLSLGSEPILIPSGVSITLRSADEETYKIERADTKRHFVIQSVTDSSLFFDQIEIDGSNQGGGISVKDSNRVLISQGVIQNCANARLGGGLIVEDSQNVVIQETLIKDNTSKVKGGGLYIENSSVELMNSDISRNTATTEPVDKDAYGGGIFVGNGSFLKMTGTVKIEKNNARSTYYNAGTFIGYGGGLYVAAHGKIDFIGNVIFLENLAGSDEYATNGSGGAIYNDSEELTITENVTIKNNRSKLFGGGIGSGGNTKVTVNGSRIEGNIVASNIEAEVSLGAGGGIYIAKNAQLILNQAIIEENKSGATGGGIQGAKDSIIEIHGGSVSRNTAATRGGAIYSAYTISTTGILDASKVLIDQDAKVNQNKAKSAYGAIYAFELTFNSGEINENIVENGFSNIHVHKFFMNGGSISNNKLETASRGVQIPGAGVLCAIAKITGGEISYNTYDKIEPEGAAVVGGGISFENYKDQPYGIEMTGGVIRGNRAVYGGGISNWFDGENNSLDNYIKISGGVIEDNIADYGGGIISRNTPVIISKNAKILNNTAKIAGGGIYQLNGTLNIMNNAEVSSNNSVTGGGIYMDQVINATIRDRAKIINNKSNLFGGGIYHGNNGGLLTIKGNVTIEGNRAENGGGLVLSKTSASIEDNVRFENNTAEVNGGGIWTNNLTKLSIPSENVTFVNNRASQGYHLIGEENIELHNKYVKTKSFTVPFQYGYNNFDINFESGNPSNVYTVEYYMNDEANGLINSETHFGGDLLVVPPVPVREGYEFIGWFRTSKGEDKWDFAVNVVEGNMKLFAGWEEAKATDVTITYHYNYGDQGIYLEQKIDRNGSIQIPKNPIREGYRFTSWYRDPECSILWDFTIASSEKHLNLYAGWEECEDLVGEKCEYPVTYLYNYPGAGVYLEQKVSKGDKLVAPIIPQRSGYKFTNWYIDANCTIIWNFTTDTVEDCLILYAGWTKITEGGSNGGSGSNGGGGGVIVKPVTPSTKEPGTGTGKPNVTEPGTTNPGTTKPSAEGGTSGQGKPSENSEGKQVLGTSKAPNLEVNKVPKTGDFSLAPISVLMILCSAVVMLVLYSKKRNVK